MCIIYNDFLTIFSVYSARNLFYYYSSNSSNNDYTKLKSYRWRHQLSCNIRLSVAKLRSWVQIHPVHFFLLYKYCIRLSSFFGECRTNSAAMPTPCSKICRLKCSEQIKVLQLFVEKHFSIQQNKKRVDKIKFIVSCINFLQFFISVY